MKFWGFRGLRLSEVEITSAEHERGAIGRKVSDSGHHNIDRNMQSYTMVHRLWSLRFKDCGYVLRGSEGWPRPYALNPKP